MTYKIKIRQSTLVMILYWSFYCHQVFGQPTIRQNYRFINFSYADGLPDKAIYDFAQDSLGFIWIGTASGLYRYDGNRFTHFVSDQETEYKQISNILQILLYDRALDRIWLSSTTDFQYFDLNDYQFYRADNKNLRIDRKLGTGGMITSMSKIAKNILWLGSSKGIESYDIQSKQWTRIDQVFRNAPADFNPSILKIYAVSPDTILISTSSHLIFYNPITHASEFIKPVDSKSIPDFYYDPVSKCIWMCTGLNLIKLDLRNKSQTVIKRNGLEHMNFTYYKISPFGNDQLWVSGSVIYDKKTGNMSHIPIGESKFDNQLLYVSCLFVDKQNNLWRGSYESACSVLPFQNHEVISFKLQNQNHADLEVYKSLKIKDQPYMLVAGNPMKGIQKLNLNTGEKSLIINGIHPKSIFGVDIIQSPNGDIYFADNMTTYSVNLKNNTLKSIHKNATETTGSNFRKLLIIKPNILIESNNNQLSFYNTNTSETKYLDIDKIDSNLNKFEDYYLRPSILAKDGTIYYVSSAGLFEQKDINAPILKSSVFTSDTGKNLLKPQEMVEDKEGNIWITSLVNGLFKYIKNKDELLNFNASNSAIESDYLQSITLEPNNIITVGSTSQLYRFDAKSGRYLNSFNKQNGFSRDDQAYGFT
ncbi:MAG: two-component regulator propeller domain-containing protein, partial [Saprospiraceae bacterium]